MLHIVTPADFTKHELIEYKINPAKITTIMNGVNFRKYKSRTPKKDNLNLLFVGHICERKGVSDLVKGFSLLPFVQLNIKLNLIGNTDYDTRYTHELKILINNLKINDFVTLHGRVKDEELDCFYERADIFILPSHWEGYGIVYIEAMSTGLPVIGANISAIPDIINDGNNGLLVPPHNPEAIKKAILNLVNDPEKRLNIGKNAYEYSQSCHTHENSNKLFYELIVKSIQSTN